MATPTVYVICDQNCKFEGMTKEQILTAIAQAVSTGEIKDVDTGFVQTIKTINGRALRFFVGEQSEYEALSKEEKDNLFAIITNDTTKAGLLETIEKIQTALTEFIQTANNSFMGHNDKFYYDCVSGNNSKSLNDIKYEFHQFICNFKNAPSLDNGWGFLEVSAGAGKGFIPSTSYPNGCEVIRQKFTGYQSGRVFTRILLRKYENGEWVGDDWSEWKPLVSSNNDFVNLIAEAGNSQYFDVSLNFDAVYLFQIEYSNNTFCGLLRMPAKRSSGSAITALGVYGSKIMYLDIYWSSTNPAAATATVKYIDGSSYSYFKNTEITISYKRLYL